MADISVIIPCYNTAAFIDRCLTSIVSQTIGLDALEIICIDDASTDDTWQRLTVWEQRYPDHILLIHCDENRKQGAARNMGLQYAASEWVSFIDSDDWLEPDYFQKMYGMAVQSNFDLIICRSVRDFSHELTFLDNRGTGKEDCAMLIDTEDKRKLFIVMKRMDYLAWGKLIRRDFLLEHQIYFPENLAYEDTFWGSLIHLYARRIFFIEEMLYHYFVNSSSTVLKQDADYHLDLLTVQSMLWEEWIERGFLQVYHDELIYDYLFSCYIGFLKVIVFRFKTPSYSLFLLLKESILSRIPDYKSNVYIQKKELSEFHSVLLEALTLPLGRTQFIQFTQYIRTIGL